MHVHFSGTLIAIVAIVMFFRYQRHRLQAGYPPFDLRRGRRGRLDRDYGGELPHSPREQELEHEVARLTERIQVLERIATDGRRERDLAAEIESLRDPQPPQVPTRQS
ncbi:MAG: hypothetical protein JSS36_06355 [Proteobacteria bacterium]|nr:hypothetical protein [Pseudomonadota bacterium]